MANKVMQRDEKCFCDRRGQSLAEILIAVALGVIMVVGAITVIAPSLRLNTNLRNAQVAGALGKEMLDNLQVVAERDWHAIDTLATTSANKYYVLATGSPFAVTTGTESVTVGSSTYSRYFYLDDVYRNTSKRIDTSGSLKDPSTMKVTVVYTWPPVNASGTIVHYVTRSRHNVFVQTDWSGGSGASGPISATSSTFKFTSSSAINYSTTTGSIRIQGI